ncbi:MAG TPA: 5-formyltetrahydrofolate cyclo-ligase [Lactobacillus sp.]|nr:5-formyltetrahydrofolate cyclo-ligase [Lactobacillus sp.]
MTTKEVIRTQVISALTHMNATQKSTESQQLVDGLVGSQMWQQAAIIGLTMSTAIELDTRPLIAQALAAGKQVAVPRTLPHRQMGFVTLGPGVSFETTSFGIQEPVGGTVIDADAMALLVVPGVAFADDGSRIGFGAGYYDRYLANYHGETVSLALSPQRFKKVSWTPDSFDIKIKQIISLKEAD